jgi:hypothetical protein
MTNPDYRALCAELLDALQNAIGVIYGEDGTKHISTADAVITKADAALAQHEPVVLTRPDCFNFAMDFLGGTEEVEVRNYIERLESAASAAQPEPVAPTVMEILELHSWLEDEWRAIGEDLPIVDFAWAIVARWGTPAINTRGTH